MANIGVRASWIESTEEESLSVKSFSQPHPKRGKTLKCVCKTHSMRLQWDSPKLDTGLRDQTHEDTSHHRSFQNQEQDSWLAHHGVLQLAS